MQLTALFGELKQFALQLGNLAFRFAQTIRRARLVFFTGIQVFAQALDSAISGDCGLVVFFCAALGGLASASTGQKKTAAISAAVLVTLDRPAVTGSGPNTAARSCS